MVVVVDGGGMKRPPLEFLCEDSQIKLYVNLNLHHDLVNREEEWNVVYSWFNICKLYLQDTALQTRWKY